MASHHRNPRWWRQFRGEVQTKRDHEVTNENIEYSNIILWGDPSSNQILARIQSRLPFKWNDKSSRIGEQIYSTDEQAPVMIYPNPLNPERFIAIKSGFTFSKFSEGSNSLQIPKLPNWAANELVETQDPQYPVGVIVAGFFNESWQFKAR